ncbi:M24 family metallopeptidase [Rhodobium gokarnense]|uniref:Xaa-Pro dipeptidase n=1 Tax=Rhodobium gokarnense TaxID=364296 RepID=A0ABT3HG49_9HYPH|nr:Xaa-Pro peptidase family protein [Rhodobium gokarnense]MCW2309382.1 Xaa-Pro dipeptidase [Rhodobium gokarnense]
MNEQPSGLSSPKKLLFPEATYRQRHAAVQAELAQRGVDLAIYDEIEAVQWLTGFGGAMNIYRCCVLPVSGDPFFVIRALDAAPFRQVSWIDDVATFCDWEDPIAVIVAAIEARGIRAARIGLDKKSYALPVGFMERLLGLLPDADFVDVGDVVTSRRMIKSEAELALMTRSAATADKAMLAALGCARQGTVLRDVVKAAYRVYLDEGADPAPVGPITVGVGEDFLHGHLRPEPLAPGEICHVELLPKFSGYSARMMRPVVVGRANARQAHVAERLIALQDAQFAAMKPGVPAREVDAVVRQALVEEGLRPDFTGISGYTAGFNGAATPRTSDFNRIFHPFADWVLEAGMTFHMYLVADGIAFSETILVTPDGSRRMTSLPRKLFESDAFPGNEDA